MKRICIFSAQYFPHLGGVENYTYHLAKYLLQKGEKVVILTSNVQRLPAYEQIEGAEVYRLPCINLLDGRYPVLKFNREFFRIHHRLMRSHFDLVLVNTRFYLHSVYGAVFARKQKTKCVMIDHGTSHLSVHNPFWDTVGGWVEHLITKVDQIFCRDFYGVSQASTQWLRHFHIKAKGVLYNAVDLEKIEAVKKSPLRDFRKEYEIPADGIVISFTGRLLKEKGIWQLIDAVKNIRKVRKDVYLLIAGEGDEEAEIREKRDEGIFLLGRLPFEEVIGLLMQSDLFCLPSDSEGFSTSVLEAAACRCFVITTENGGSKELISGSRYGKLIPDNRRETVEKALMENLDNREYRERAAKNAYQKLARNFTWDIVSEKVRNL